ncbi:MAG TPA: sugar phosphate nucleotidyltransferase [Candidatus Limnocylindria bacterium]|jgi:mannose-1-phosphate guanylyltransferase|nr:sugar phosphate nucleotidyltransferase [Candidatus Limnocylindria bacterium]
MFAIVMAGGVGTRLWPLSRRRSPKQLLALTGDTSLLQQTVARLGALLKPHDIYVITSQAHVRATQEQLPQLPADNVLGEPLARSTAVAAGLATVLARRESDELALVLPADHFLGDEAAFTEALREGMRAAERGYLVTLGVVPQHAATGYGYIKVGERLHEAVPTALVERFVEKPDATQAEAFLSEGGYLWNAGIFIWRVYAFRQALERFQPELAAALARIGELRRTPGWMSDVRDILEPIPAVQIDAGIAEQAAAEGRVAVVPLDAGWSDIGSWSALLEALSAKTGDSLVASGRHLDRGSQRVLVHGGDRLVVTVGLHDVIIVDTPDALLVCARDRAEEIKPVLDEIARKVGDQYL